MEHQPVIAQHPPVPEADSECPGSGGPRDPGPEAEGINGQALDSGIHSRIVEYVVLQLHGSAGVRGPPRSTDGSPPARASRARVLPGGRQRSTGRMRTRRPTRILRRKGGTSESGPRSGGSRTGESRRTARPRSPGRGPSPAAFRRARAPRVRMAEQRRFRAERRGLNLALD